MIDKELSQELGIYDFLDSIKYGHMRYGENIFDQQSSLIQDGIMASQYSEDEKIQLLGQHVFEELQTHPVFEDGYADGGKPIPAPKYRNFQKQEISALVTPVRNFYTDYILSPNYLKRLKGAGYADPQMTKTERLVNNLKVVPQMMNSFSSNESSYYTMGGDKIYIDPMDTSTAVRQTPQNVIAHEYSHAIIGKGNDALMDDSEGEWINSVNKFRGPEFQNSKDPGVLHDKDPIEMKAAIDVLRYRLKHDKIYDTGTQDFNQLFLNKSKQLYKNDENINGLFKSLSDKDLIKFMNTVASNKTMNANYSFASGGKTTPNKKTSAAKPQLSTYFYPKGNTADLINARNLYNSWAKTVNLPELQAGSDFNDAAAAAFANYNADPTNLRKLSVSSQKYTDPTTGASRRMVDRIELEKFLPEIKPASPVVGFNKKGESVYSDQVKPTVVDKASGKLLVVDKDYFPTYVDSSLPVKNTTPKTVDGREARNKAFRNSSMVSNVANLATAAIGSIFAAEPQPLYSPTSEYEKMRDDVYARKDQGLSAEQTALLNQNSEQTYANSVAALSGLVGGGSNQGAVLASLGQLSGNLDRSKLNNALVDIDAQQRNQQIYRGVVMGDQQLDQQLFGQVADRAAQTQQNGLAMLSQGVQGVLDRENYNAAYGPGSLYNSLQESQLAGAQKYQDLQARQTELALEEIRKSAGLGTLPVNPTPSNVDIRKLPTIQIPR